MKYLIIALIALIMAGCDVEESLDKAEKSLQETKKELEAKVESDQITPQRPEPIEQVEQITPSRPTTGNVEIIEDVNTSNNYKAGDAITGIDGKLLMVTNTKTIRLSSVVHNSTTGDYSTSTGRYYIVSVVLPPNSTKTLTWSTKPNTSIRAILSPFGVQETNEKIDRSRRDHLYYTVGDIGIFTTDSVKAVIAKNPNDGEYTVNMYFSIDNDNTDSYFDAETCKLAIGVQ